MENAQIFDFALSDADMQALRSLNKEQRFFNMDYKQAEQFMLNLAPVPSHGNHPRLPQALPRHHRRTGLHPSRCRTDVPERCLRGEGAACHPRCPPFRDVRP